jgi:hypothetical protein
LRPEIFIQEPGPALLILRLRLLLIRAAEVLNITSVILEVELALLTIRSKGNISTVSIQPFDFTQIFREQIVVFIEAFVEGLELRI